MQYLTLPNTQLEVSQLAFGCWGIASDFHWGERDDRESLEAIAAALDSGVNFFDTAEVYGKGASEELLGKALAGKRDQVVLASKPLPTSVRPDEIAEACERSLKRLGTDYLDLYQLHWPSREVPLAETWGAVLKLKEQGKIREAAVCNHGVQDLREISRLRPPVTDQLPYNLLWRAIEHEILPACRESGVGVLAYSPLQHGLLADKYRAAADVPDGRARSRHFSTDRELARHGEAGCEKETFAAIDAIRDICRSIDRSMADVALAWTAAQPGVSCVIAGVRNAAQLRENLATLDNPLSGETLQRLAAATDSLKQTLGANPDMWQGEENSRYR